MLRSTKLDIERYQRQPARFTLGTLSTILRYEGLQATLAYRFGRTLQSLKWWIPLWPVLLVGWLLYAIAIVYVRYGYGISLTLSARIGPGLYIGHFGGIELHNCSLGARCSIGQQAKIGRSSEAIGPTIGDRVWIGSHSHVFGAIVIGDGATLGAGAQVTTDVSAKSLCLGRPARVAMRDYDNSAFL